jgi:hypothetical protein
MNFTTIMFEVGVTPHTYGFIPLALSLVVLGVVSTLGILWAIGYFNDHEVAIRNLRMQMVEFDEPDEHFDQFSDATRITRIALGVLKAELGALTDTAANRMIVSDRCRKYLTEHGLRPSHIARVYLLIVEMFFYKTEQEVMFEKYRKTTYSRKWRRTGSSA